MSTPAVLLENSGIHGITPTPYPDAAVAVAALTARAERLSITGWAVVAATVDGQHMVLRRHGRKAGSVSATLDVVTR